MNNNGSTTADDLRALIDRPALEEDIHQFLKERVIGIGTSNPRFSERFISGTLSKFPVTPDRIPDFVSVMLNVERSQRPSRMAFIELKRADAPIYTSHSRMSKDLNDAWMECVETSRLLADTFRDCLRRIVKELDQERLSQFDKVYYDLAAQQGTSEERIHEYEQFMPRCHSVIVIGRRSSLDLEGLLRTRELSASTGHAIQVITYDTVLDWVAEAHDESRPLFMPGWYW